MYRYPDRLRANLTLLVLPSLPEVLKKQSNLTCVLLNKDQHTTMPRSLDAEPRFASERKKKKVRCFQVQAKSSG